MWLLGQAGITTLETRRSCTAHSDTLTTLHGSLENKAASWLPLAPSALAMTIPMCAWCSTLTSPSFGNAGLHWRLRQSRSWWCCCVVPYIGANKVVEGKHQGELHSCYGNKLWHHALCVDGIDIGCLEDPQNQHCSKGDWQDGQLTGGPAMWWCRGGQGQRLISINTNEAGREGEMQKLVNINTNEPKPLVIVMVLGETRRNSEISDQCGYQNKTYRRYCHWIWDCCQYWLWVCPCLQRLLISNGVCTLGIDLPHTNKNPINFWQPHHWTSHYHAVCREAHGHLTKAMLWNTTRRIGPLRNEMFTETCQIIGIHFNKLWQVEAAQNEEGHV